MHKIYQYLKSFGSVRKMYRQLSPIGCVYLKNFIQFIRTVIAQ